jgi:dCTP deaminase
MILADRDIEKAIKNRHIIITPTVEPSQFDSSSLNLRVGSDFRRWKDSLRAPSTRHSIDLDSVDLSDLIDLTDPIVPESDGVVVIEPGWFVLVRTLEFIALPLRGKVAARVEGRSRQARLGMTAHVTAPTIHAGFEGQITLEILNVGPFFLRVVPNQSQLCQVIFETVHSVPERGGSRTFSAQETPLGTPTRKSRSKGRDRG